MTEIDPTSPEGERYQAYLAEIKRIEEQTGIPENFAIKEVILPPRRLEALVEYYQKSKATTERELEELEERKERLQARPRSGGSNQYIKEVYRKSIRARFCQALAEDYKLNFIEIYNVLKVDPAFTDSASEFVHQFATNMTAVAHEVGLAEHNVLPNEEE